MTKCENRNCEGWQGTVESCCAEYDDISDCSDSTFTLPTKKNPWQMSLAMWGYVCRLLMRRG